MLSEYTSNFKTPGCTINAMNHPNKTTAIASDSPAVYEAIFADRYKIREKIGEGGMGTVYLADQVQPVQRRVAIKLIKGEFATNSTLARFEQERQALALMDHPNIAKVFDAGVAQAPAGMSSENIPYFVMELIRGVSITRYCDDVKLTPRERLELFIPVCQAVQHAHQKGLIHRDLKPSNILIGLYDGKPVPKIIDFGVAKATGPRLSDQTVYTEIGRLIGTLEYMSPEQADYNNLDIDTRTDIYALGVILYELLSGSVPFSQKEFASAGLVRMLMMIKEEEPAKPSTKVSSSESLPSIAATRKLEPNKLTKLLRGDLDWIVMKALEKDRRRRYETANGFAQDVQRYLNGEPVQAHPPSAAYRIKKFVRRHRGQVIAAGLVLLALVAGIIGTSWGLVAARRSEKAAQLAQKDAEQRRQEAEAEKRVAQAVRDFLQNKLLGQADVTAQADSLLAQGATSNLAKPNPTIRELLDRAADELTELQIETNFPGQPALQAEILQTMGNTYRGIGEYDRAVGFLDRSRQLYRQHLGLDHPSTLISMNNLAGAYNAAGKRDPAVALYEETLKLSKLKLGTVHADTILIRNDLALAYQDAGKMPMALPLFEEVLKFRKANLGVDHPLTLASMNNLANGYQDTGRLDQALLLYEEALRLKKVKQGAEHPDTITTMNNLASAYWDAGKKDLAVPLLEETLKLRKSKLGSEHPLSLQSMNNLAVAYIGADRVALAVPLLEEAFALRKAKLGPDHPSTLSSMKNLANAYQSTGKLELALRMFDEAFRLMKSKLGVDHPHTLICMNDLAMAYFSAKRLDQSVPLMESTLKLRESKSGRQHPDTLMAAANLGVNYKEANRLSEALPLLEEAYRESKKHVKLRFVREHLIKGYLQAGKRESAAQIQQEILADARQQPKESPKLIGQLSSVALSLIQAKSFTDAETLLRECLAICEKAQPDVWQTFNVRSLLGGALFGQKKYAEAELLLLQGYQGMKRLEPAIPPRSRKSIPEALERLIELYTAMNKPDEVKKWQAEKDSSKSKTEPVESSKP